MFLGTFSTKLMLQNQFVLASKLARNLKSNKLVISQGFDKCIYGFDVDEWQKIAQTELLKPLLSGEGRQMRQQIFSKAEEVDLDKQRRFVLPDYLVDFAGLKEELVVIGAGDHFEIWDKDEWLSYSSTLK